MPRVPRAQLPPGPEQFISEGARLFIRADLILRGPMRGSKDQPARVQRSAALYQQAAALFLQALQEEPGNALAQANLGYCLWSTDDYAKAVVWYHNAAKQGHARAQSNQVYVITMAKVLDELREGDGVLGESFASGE